MFVVITDGAVVPKWPQLPIEPTRSAVVVDVVVTGAVAAPASGSCVESEVVAVAAAVVADFDETIDLTLAFVTRRELSSQSEETNHFHIEGDIGSGLVDFDRALVPKAIEPAAVSSRHPEYFPR